ncbi:hypothetical protein EWB00_004895 [Schistosoma japonicum]|uniref:Uncharacterized protein n=1 Tax=Schistosoma japonicum TaxID=6182 RepID=A0A4Z2D3K1_SCHJA|nr:hypothetical protein EWB00_004895 [Schistosoma japonicum]
MLYTIIDASGLSDHLITCLLTLVIFTETTLSDLHQVDLLVKMKAQIVSATAEKTEWLKDTCRQVRHQTDVNPH